MKPNISNLSDEQRDIKNWPEVYYDKLEPRRKKMFEIRKKSITSWFNGKELKYICAENNICRSQLYSWINRCIAKHKDGRIFGWRGIIPFKNNVAYKGNVSLDKTNGHPGSLKQLFESHPEIHSKLVDNYFSNKKGQERFKQVNTLHKEFIKLCRNHGIKDDEYPLNTVTVARASFYRYFKHLSEINYKKFLETRQPEAPNRSEFFTSPNDDNFIPCFRPYERVEIDGHRIDLQLNAVIQQVDGSFTTKEIERIWIIACIDKASRAILGYHLSYSREYSSADVLMAVKNSIDPWSPKEIVIPGLTYALGAGFPSGLIEDLKWSVFDEIALDNAKAHLSKIVVENLLNIVNCAFNDGPVGTPEIRGVVERFFGTLEERGIHRLPGTTGSSPDDKRRIKGDLPVVEADELESLLEVLIANYNATPHSGLKHKSPIQYLESYIDSNNPVFRHLPNHLQRDNSIASFSIERTVRGNKDEGRRPYIQYENAVYKNIVLSNSFSLIGQKLTIVVDITDLRTVKAYLPNGEELGVLSAQGEWSLSKHDLKLRKSICKLVTDRAIIMSKLDDPVTIYLEYLAMKAESSKRARNMYIRTKKASTEFDADGHQAQETSQDTYEITDTYKPNTEKSKARRISIKINRTLDY